MTLRFWQSLRIRCGSCGKPIPCIGINITPDECICRTYPRPDPKTRPPANPAPPLNADVVRRLEKVECIVKACEAWNKHIVFLYSDEATVDVYSIHEMFKSILRGEGPGEDKHSR